MQSLTFVFMLVLVALASAQRASVGFGRPQVQLPLPKPHQPPIFPGHGSFNPHAGGRFRRSPQNGQVDFGVNKQGGKTSWNVEGSQKVWGNEHGSINVNAGANHPAGGHTDKHVGISGTFNWGK